MWQMAHTWVCENNSIKNAELDDVDMDVAQSFNVLKQTWN